MSLLTLFGPSSDLWDCELTCYARIPRASRCRSGASPTRLLFDDPPPSSAAMEPEMEPAVVTDESSSNANNNNEHRGGNDVLDSIHRAIAAGSTIDGRSATAAGGRGGGGGGRTSTSGRGLVSTTHDSRGRGGGRNENSASAVPFQQQQTQPRPVPVKIHASSGVPFGHVPAYLPGSSSLIEELDHRVMVVLRDGKHLIGTLASFDQFSNLVLLDAIERQIVVVRDKSMDIPAHNTGFGDVSYFFADIPLGVYIVRGDSLVVAGEVHPEEGNTNYPTPGMQRVSLEELQKLARKAEPPMEWDFDGDLIA